MCKKTKGALPSAMTEMLSTSRVFHSSGLVHMDAAVYCTAKRLAVKGSFATVVQLIDVRGCKKNNNALVMMMTQIVLEIRMGVFDGVYDNDGET